MLILLLLLMDIGIGLCVLALSGSWLMALVAYVACTIISLYVVVMG
jgi:hypothetical protein